MRELTQAVRSGEYTSPKTVLGFFAFLATVLIGGAVAGTLVLSGSPSLRYLVLPIWIFVGLIVLVLLGVTVWAMWRDPTRLMLGQMSGHEYIEYHRLTQGDSQTGERVETTDPLSIPLAIAKEAQQTDVNRKEPDRDQ